MSTINDKTFAACQNLRKALAATKHCDVTFQHKHGAHGRACARKNANENHPMSNNAFIPSFDTKLLKQSIFNGPKHSFLTKKTNITWCLSAILKTEIICCLHRNTHTITVNSCIKS